jgi:hypothetical protein
MRSRRTYINMYVDIPDGRPELKKMVSIGTLKGEMPVADMFMVINNTLLLRGELREVPVRISNGKKILDKSFGVAIMLEYLVFGE